MTKAVPEFVYTAVSEGGSGMYAYERFLGTAFSIDELRGLMKSCHAGPVPGDHYNLTRRKIGGKKTNYMTVWRTESWDDLETKVWR